ncbi:MAG: GNAT family N-acetyltransferase [Xanthomonadaceae bacterium]|nr:GNAT family N-acetyltransferase [Rhodospirillaceae bacterium]NIA17669.1 GNAT family N-acetyltransferase [Xanthomonadaceae bacterium]
MKKYLTIKIKVNKKKEAIDFGIPDTKEELDDMFKSRYKVYFKKDYIDENKQKRDFDEYDENGDCIYFIATYKGKIVGSARIIKSNFLPTEKDCFRFREPKKISLIPRNQRTEVSRLIVLNNDPKNYFPRHLIMIGLLHSISLYSKEDNLLGGYSFIKDNLKKKLKKLKIPFYLIEPFEQIYNKGVLTKYFNDRSNPVWPIYYFRDEIFIFTLKIFNNNFLFKKNSKNEYEFKHCFLWKILLKFFKF